jgi:catechol 2,3-dioxygenase-like lactoylglutathione lyase family enzyme
MKKVDIGLAVLAVVMWSCSVGFAQQGKVQQRPAITGIAFVRIDTSDVAAAESFYGSELGFEATKSKDGPLRYAVNPSQWLELVPQSVPTPVSRVELVAFTTRDIAGLRRYLESQHVGITGELPDGFTVRDPEGNPIGFVQTGAMDGRLKLSDHATSHRLIHAGMIVKSADAENAFYRDVLGFHPYWHGGQKDGVTDYYSVQVPDGTDWLEYMLNVPADADAKVRGVFNHVSLGVETMRSAVDALAKDGCEGPVCRASQMGRDGKVQLNLYDPDHTRVEFMEFRPSGMVCCSAFLGRSPSETEDR